MGMASRLLTYGDKTVSATELTPASAAHLHPAGAQRTFLIVEDHAIVRAALCDWLNEVYRSDYIAAVGSGEEAVEVVRQFEPRLVLMDINLPGLTGLEATRQIKALCPQTLVVILSIHETIQYQAHALEAGATAFVPKRKMHTELIRLLNDLLGPAR
jgi:DNA-binding NarL/FixJ family response regulator